MCANLAFIPFCGAVACGVLEGDISLNNLEKMNLAVFLHAILLEGLV